jgi:hypothetical protein
MAQHGAAKTSTTDLTGHDVAGSLRAAAYQLVVHEDRGPVPGRVRNAVLILVAGLALGFLMNLLTWLGIVSIPGLEGQAIVYQVSSGLATFLLWGALTWKIYVGRNWARIILLVLTVLAVPGLVMTFALSATVLKGMPLIFVVTSGVHVTLEIIATYMLFSGDSKAWFR